MKHDNLSMCVAVFLCWNGLRWRRSNVNFVLDFECMLCSLCAFLVDTPKWKIIGFKILRPLSKMIAVLEGSLLKPDTKYNFRFGNQRACLGIRGG